MKSVVNNVKSIPTSFSTPNLRDLTDGVKSGLYQNPQGIVVLVPQRMGENKNKGLPIVVGGMGCCLGETLCGFVGPWTYMNEGSSVTLSNGD